MLEPTLGAVVAAGLLVDIDTLQLDRGYDYPVVRQCFAALWAWRDLDIQRRGTKEPGRSSRCDSACAGIVEATKSWWDGAGVSGSVVRRSRP